LRRPILIGITGGIGGGKSTLVDAFTKLGAVPFSADTAVHELYGDEDVITQVRERWGDDVLDSPTGRIDRSAIASIVFHNEDERRWLESVLHPRVGEAWHAFVASQSALAQPPQFIVAEVPLLFEAGLEDRYDAVVTISAPLDTRIERAEARGTGRTLSAQRAAAQMPEEEKLRRANFTFANTGSIDDIHEFAVQVLRTLRDA
jgi:dephospho-CoA kinase